MISLLVSLQATSDAHFPPSAPRPGERRAVPGAEVQPPTTSGRLQEPPPLLAVAAGTAPRLGTTGKGGQGHGSGGKYSTSCWTREAEN